ncbi:MAG: hypothetical protein EPO28_16845 [Saprospiraceae bacterium]|nr:MAG: hypothetical protein EPO28_16845 [Saprospiraceae bacterium]
MKTTYESGAHTGSLSYVAHVQVQFGAPSKNCLHFGICRVELLKTRQAGGKPCQATALLRKWEDKGLELSWHQNGMNPETIRRYFTGGVFRVEEPYVLPGEVVEALDIQTFTIQPGIYPVLETEQHLKVIFT